MGDQINKFKIKIIKLIKLKATYQNPNKTNLNAQLTKET